MRNISVTEFENAKKEFRDMIRSMTKKLSESSPKLGDVQEELIGARYTVKNPIVYNKDLCKVNPAEIKLILVADNPGRNEQANESYLDLDGASGKMAKNLLVDNSVYGIKDFRKNVLVLNKTPIHTPATEDLRKLCRREKEMGGHLIKDELEISQEKMASILLQFHKALDVPVWIVGCSKLNGLFKSFTKKLYELYQGEPNLFKDVLVFCHFSYGGFARDLKKENPEWESLPKDRLIQILKKIGTMRKGSILRQYPNPKRKPAG